MAPNFRIRLRATDPADIEQLVRETEFFSADEIAIARELADDGVANGSGSHYHFILADDGDKLLGYTCFGPVPCTRSSWDLYWIAVAPREQRRRLGHALLTAVEDAVCGAGGTHIYVDTSSRPQYAPTRAFYTRCGYAIAADFPNFYAPGDGKIVFVRELGECGSS